MPAIKVLFMYIKAINYCEKLLTVVLVKVTGLMRNREITKMLEKIIFNFF
jgi:hypothetical protein